MLFVIIMGVVAILFVLISIYVGLSSRKWPFTIGNIIASEVRTRSCDRNTNKCLSYYPHIKYRYEISQKEYESDFVGNYLVFGGDEAIANDISNEFPQGREVKVFYHPLLNGISVISPGLKQAGIHLSLLVLSMALTGIGIYLLS